MKTVLIDRANSGRASDAGAGIISPETSTRDSSVWFDFAIRAARYYPTLIEEIGQHESGYAKCGLLKIAVSHEELETYEQTKTFLIERNRRRLGGRHNLHEISPNETREIFPPVKDVVGALYNDDAARVDGRLLVKSILSVAKLEGLRVLNGSVNRLITTRGRVTGVKLGDDTLSAQHTVLACGAWTNSFQHQLGRTLPIEPQRGQIIHLFRKDIETKSWPIVDGLRGHYIVAWPDHRVVVGATRECGSGFEPCLTTSGVLEVLSEALRIAPGLAPWTVREMRVGLRPVSPDGLPILGKVPGIEGAYLATGHGSTGLTTGPYSAKLIADLILGRSLDVDISPFDASRFLNNT